MRLVCPCCAATASAEAWANDAEARDTLAGIVAMPRAVQTVALAYMGLFRPGGNALGWGRARRVAQGLAALIAEGRIAVDKKPPRPCPPQVWAEAMAVVVERRPGQLKNHNYLRQVAYELADRADAREETAAEARRQARGPEGPRGTLTRVADVLPPVADRADPAEEKAAREKLARLGIRLPRAAMGEGHE